MDPSATAQSVQYEQETKVKVQFWRIMLDLIPYRVGNKNRLWHWAFKHYDEAIGCGCWRY